MEPAEISPGLSTAPEGLEVERREEPRSGGAGSPQVSAVGRCIEQVNLVVEELRLALDQMEEVLETVELAERQKIDDEREIEALQQALRKLRRPAQTDPPRH